MSKKNKNFQSDIKNPQEHTGRHGEGQQEQRTEDDSHRHC